MAFRRFTISSTGKKLLSVTLLFSSLITLVTTSIQLYAEFNSEVFHLDDRFVEINDVVRDSLTESTWAFDQNQIQKQLKGILRFEQVAKAHLDVEGFKSFELANGMVPNGPVKMVPLIYKDSHGAHEIGLLTVTFTMQQIYGGLINRGLVMLITNFLRTLMFSFFLLYMFYSLVTKPFRELAAKAREASTAQLDLMELSTDTRRSPRMRFRGHDELHEMAESLSLMQRNFQKSYEALKTSENRFRDIIADSFDYVFETDPDGVFSFVSSNVKLGDPLKTKVVVGESLFQLPLEPDVKNALLAQAKVQDALVTIETADGRTIYNTTINPVYNLENYFQGYRGLLSDVTAPLLIKERHEKQEDQIRHIQKVGMIGELAAGFAHDFNNILAIVLGNAAILNRLLTQNSIVSPNAGKAVNGIQSATLRGQALIQKIMTFSRRTGSELQPEDLAEVLNSMLPLIHVAASKKVKVSVDSQRGLWKVRVDAAGFENVVINLTINARDAMPEGGRLKIGLANKTLIENTSFCVAGDYVVLTVTDNGEGIPEELRERIFEPFFTTKEAGHGTGLGLSTVLNFVQQSYGAVTVDSKVSQGTVFSIYLPRYQEKQV
jgi:signal transduction histidine kinase